MAEDASYGLVLITAIVRNNILLPFAWKLESDKPTFSRDGGVRRCLDQPASRDRQCMFQLLAVASVLTSLPSGFRHYQGGFRWSRSSQMFLPFPVCIRPIFAWNSTRITLFCSVGRPKHVRVMAGALEGDVFIGRRAQEFRGLLKIKYPMEHGIVTDWDDMERIWSWIYAEELGTLSEEVRCILVQPASHLKHSPCSTPCF